jgi:hypothetical protein
MGNIEINEHYFDRKRRTEKQKRDLYYILGGWYASGSNIEDTHIKKDRSISTYRGVKFQNKDKRLVDIVIKQLQYKSTQKFHKSPRSKNRRSRWFEVSGVDSLCDRLDELGCGKPREEREFPKIPKKYLADFVRGFLDAKGHLNKKKRQLTVSFNEKFIKVLREVLEKYAYVKGGGNQDNILIYSPSDIARIYNFIYKDDGLYLASTKRELGKVEERRTRPRKTFLRMKRRIIKAAKVIREGGTVTRASKVAYYSNEGALYKPFERVMEMTVMEYRAKYRQPR